MGACWFDAPRTTGLTSVLESFPVREDLPFAEYRVPFNVDATFDPDSAYWDPDLYALRIIPEFPWDSPIDIPDFPATDSKQTRHEIERLLDLAVTERPQALDEIISQDQNFQVWWLQLLTMNRSSHPNTYLLMKIAARVGETLMVNYKLRFNRPRPSQICPTLYPPVPVPGHSSYPAGHAVIGQLTSNCLCQVVSSASTALDYLARRVAKNREIAGLHFASDCDAGRSVAEQAVPLLETCATYRAVRDLAKDEW
jgi:hypothetical protein